MKLKEIIDNYYDTTATLSSINRQMAFAGIGIVWIFTTVKDASITIENTLLWSLLCFVISLGLDFLQYLYRSILFGSIHRIYEKKYYTNDVLEEDIIYYAWYNYPMYFFFYIKLISIIVGYTLVGYYIISKLSTI